MLTTINKANFQIQLVLLSKLPVFYRIVALMKTCCALLVLMEKLNLIKSKNGLSWLDSTPQVKRKLVNSV